MHNMCSYAMMYAMTRYIGLGAVDGPQRGLVPKIWAPSPICGPINRVGVRVRPAPAG